MATSLHELWDTLDSYYDTALDEFEGMVLDVSKLTDAGTGVSIIAGDDLKGRAGMHRLHPQIPIVSTDPRLIQKAYDMLGIKKETITIYYSHFHWGGNKIESGCGAPTFLCFHPDEEWMRDCFQCTENRSTRWATWRGS